MKHLVMLAMGSVLILSIAGCPQPTTPDPQGEQNTPADTTEPTLEAFTLTGPGFSLTVPAGFSLEVDSHPSVPFYHIYRDNETGCAIGVSVEPFSENGGVYEDVTFRTKGSFTSTTGDFLVVSRAVADSAEIEQAATLLADGSVLYVAIGSLSFSAMEEATAAGIFASIDTDSGSRTVVEQLYRNDTPEIIASAANGMIVLSDGSVWGIPINPTFEELQEVRSWTVGDDIIPQQYDAAGSTIYEFVHIGHWVPIEVLFLGAANAPTIASIDGDNITLSDGTAWVLFTGVPLGWNTGDTILVVSDLTGVNSWLIHQDTGDAIQLN